MSDLVGNSEDQFSRTGSYCYLCCYVIIVDAASVASLYNDQLDDMMLGLIPHNKSKGIVS